MTPSTRGKNPQRTRGRGTGPQGGQPRGHPPDPQTRAAQPDPHSTDPNSHTTPNRAPQPPASHITSARVLHHNAGQSNQRRPHPTPERQWKGPTTHHGTAIHSTTRSNTAHGTAAHCRATHHDKALHDTTHHNTMQRDAAQHGAARRATAQHTTAPDGMARHDRAERTKTQHRPTRHSSETRHDTARRTKAHHNTKARDTNRGSNPRKPPHTPEGGERRPQPWDNATPGHCTEAKGHRTPGNDGDAPPTQTATRTLKVAPQRRRDTEYPTPPNPRPQKTAWRNRPASRART